MNFEAVLKQFAFQALKQSLINRETQWKVLPKDQQEALDKILDAMIIKSALEFGVSGGGNQL